MAYIDSNTITELSFILIIKRSSCSFEKKITTYYILSFLKWFVFFFETFQPKWVKNFGHRDEEIVLKSKRNKIGK